MPCCWMSFWACVPLPDPGGPRRINLICVCPPAGCAN